jgi:phosphoribosylformylglycinamidine cyclo-ligase
MEDAYGPEWHDAELRGKKLGELALHPSQIYTKAVVEMFGGFAGEPEAEVHGVAHITGGGLPGKLGRILKPSGLGAMIDNPFQPCDLMLHCQEKSGTPDREAYETWNMGQGMVIVTPKPDKVMEIAKRHDIESQVIGHILPIESIIIKNKGHFKEDKHLAYKNGS